MTEVPPRTEDIFRHLEDLRSRSYEGTRDWADRVAVFHRAVSLLDPVVREILDGANEAFLAGTGTIHRHTGEDRDGGVYAHWELSWPLQREATAGTAGGWSRSRSWPCSGAAACTRICAGPSPGCGPAR